MSWGSDVYWCYVVVFLSRRDVALHLSVHLRCPTEYPSLFVYLLLDVALHSSISYCMFSFTRLSLRDGLGGSAVVFGSFGAEGRWFEHHSTRHVWTLGKSLALSCLYTTWCGALRGCLGVKFDSCKNLLSFVHSLLVNILQCQIVY